VAKLKIPLEVCPTSNLQISGIMETYAEHPMKRYMDLGIPVTINTDNRLMSQIDLTHEYERVVEAFSFTPSDVLGLVLNSIDVAFAPDETKCTLRERIEAFFDKLSPS